MNEKNRTTESKDSQPDARAKRALFTVVTLLVPLLVLLLTEGILRLAGYGPSLELFVQEESEGRTLWVMNPELKARYFSKTQFTPSTSLDFFQSPKPEGTYRIFCLGASTTVGFPFGQAGSFSSFLREQLKAAFPGRPIEVINLGMTATNSYTVNDIAAELGAQSPDLVIVYDGHNEFYGALGSASQEAVSGARWVTKLYLELIHLKIFQLVRDAIAWGAGRVTSSEPQAPSGTTLMETLAREQTIAYGSDLYGRTLENFRSNLEELSEIGTALDIPVIVCTQVSNLRDLPPFVTPPLDEAQSPSIPQLLESIRDGLDAWKRGDLTKARESFSGALRIDSTRADVHFAAGRCLDSLGDRQSALAHYRLARDYDQLRFRTSGEFNEAIRQAARKRGLILADVESAFMAASQDSLIGSDLVLEHVHPTLRGYALIADLLVRTMREHGLVADRAAWESVRTGTVETHHALTAIDLRSAQKRMEKLLSAWPFNGTLTVRITPPVTDGLDDIINRYVQAQTSWEQAHVEAAEHHGRRGDHQAAREEYRALARQFPLKSAPLVRLAQVNLTLNQTEEAQSALEQALAIAPSASAYSLLGLIELNARRDSVALPLLEKAFALSADRDEIRQSGYLLGLAHVRLGNPAQALAPLKASLQSDPAFEPSRQLLNRVEQIVGRPR